MLCMIDKQAYFFCVFLATPPAPEPRQISLFHGRGLLLHGIRQQRGRFQQRQP